MLAYLHEHGEAECDQFCSRVLASALFSAFADENFRLKHTGAGTLTMAHSGPGTNGSGFFLTFDATDWNDGRHVVFGRVVAGLEVLRAIEAVGSQSGQPSSEVSIVDCGEL